MPCPLNSKEYVPDMKKLTLILALCAAAVTAVPAIAHHSFAMFEMSKEVSVEGTVKSFAYTNPHAWLYIDVTEDGKTTTWGFELGAPTLLQRQKIFPSTFKPGDIVKVEGAAMKDGRPGGLFVRAYKQDGTLIGRPKDAPPPKPSE
jgi:hypothetical protein